MHVAHNEDLLLYLKFLTNLSDQDFHVLPDARRSLLFNAGELCQNLSTCVIASPCFIKIFVSK